MNTKKGSFYKTLLSKVILFALSFTLNAQDIHFSQFDESPLTLNPAVCGAYSGQILATVNYRNQWPTISGSNYGYNTMAASFQLHNVMKKWIKGYLSPGISFFSDKTANANLQTTNVDLTIASGIYLNPSSSLSGGLQAGWGQQSINLQNIEWGEQVINGQYDPHAPSGEPSTGNSFSYLDFSAGIYYHYTQGQTTMTKNNQFKLNLGAAVFHVNEPQLSYYGQSTPGSDLYMRFVLHGNVFYLINNTNFGIVPSFMFMQQGPAQEFDIGSKLRYALRSQHKYTGEQGAAIYLGAYYRWNDAIVALLGLELGSYAIGLSYDLNTSSLINATTGLGGFEISLRFLNPNPFLSGQDGMRNNNIPY